MNVQSYDNKTPPRLHKQDVSKLQNQDNINSLNLENLVANNDKDIIKMKNRSIENISKLHNQNRKTPIQKVHYLEDRSSLNQPEELAKRISNNDQPKKDKCIIS